MSAAPSWSLHDDPDGREREAAAGVDAGLGAANAQAAPLHEVRPLACYARAADGSLLGGVVGRTWGECAELQQLWVEPARRGQGLGSALVGRFEALARERGCRLAYLETFSFQAPRLYARLGYERQLLIAGYAPGIEKQVMVKRLDPPAQNSGRLSA